MSTPHYTDRAIREMDQWAEDIGSKASTLVSQLKEGKIAAAGESSKWIDDLSSLMQNFITQLEKEHGMGGSD